jgi:hypothetical protein
VLDKFVRSGGETPAPAQVLARERRNNSIHIIAGGSGLDEPRTVQPVFNWMGKDGGWVSMAPI